MTVDLLLTDCMKYMRTVPDRHFDLAIVDPPYGLGTDFLRNSKSRTKKAPCGSHHLYANDRDDRPSKAYFVELSRVSKNQIIWGANHLCDLFDASGPGWIIWDKEATGYFSECELAYSSFRRSARRFRYRWNGMIQGDHGNKRLNEIRIHPSQKPVALYGWLLREYAAPGQRILDTHLGSGSSAIAAHYAGLDFVGCEIDPHFHSATCNRYRAETAQVDFLRATS